MSVRRRTPARVRRLAAALTGAALVAGCTVGPSSRPDLAVYGGAPATSSTAPALPLGPGGPGRQAEFVNGWQPCDDLDPPVDGAAAFETSCARMLVPMDGSDPSGTDVVIPVARARSTGLAEDAPTLVVVDAAGPLEADLSEVARIATVAAGLPAALTAKYQIVTLDVRGTPNAGGGTCWRDQPFQSLYTLAADPAEGGAAADLLDLTRAFTFGCQDYIGPDMVHFGTSQAADDLDSLRSALGRDTLDVLGIGYGATLGAVYVDRYPGRVGRVALDSPTDHSRPPAERAVSAAGQFERAAQAFYAECAASADCPLGADPAATVTAAVTALDADPSDDLGSSAVLWAMTMALPDQARWGDLGTAIAAAAGGDTAPLADLLDTLLDDPPAAESARMMIDCNDSGERLADSDLPTAFGDAAKTAPLFGPFLVSVSSLCRQWPTPAAALGVLHGEGATPVLVVGGVDDPVAPYVGVQTVAGQLASASLISYQGVRHGGYRGSTCVSDAVDRYLLDGTLPTADTLCPA